MNPRLAELPLLAKLGLTCCLAVVAMGFWASLEHLKNDKVGKDHSLEAQAVDTPFYALMFGEQALKEKFLLHLEGDYSGVTIPAPFTAALDGAPPHNDLAIPDEDLAVLREWIEGEDLIGGFDDFDRFDPTPADLLAMNCAECHAAGADVPLARWEDVSPLLSEKVLKPTPKKIKILSMHTHALTMGTIGIVLGLLAIATRWPRAIASLPLFIGGVGVLIDVACWIPSADNPALIIGIIAGGAMYTTGAALSFVLTLADMWLPDGKRAGDAN